MICVVLAVCVAFQGIMIARLICQIHELRDEVKGIDKSLVLEMQARLLQVEAKQKDLIFKIVRVTQVNKDV